MGVPKFYRWISERYPCLSEKIREYQIPDFDNLYLDMNGIIHSCSHPNDDDVHLRIAEEVIFREIFRYIDYLFRMIKPGKVFFMAIDGVAPRAKMNQQRGRRFRSAKMALDQEAEAIKKGEKLPDDDRFDSNCITPGTEFMAKLHDQLQYFVKVKVSTDPLWQREGLCIYLSGHDVPGEGEHKIMDFIRHIRSQPDYNADTRHCLYGLDADLIMLGLSSHELHFSLLREEVKFGTQKKRTHKRPDKILQSNPGDTKFDISAVSIFKPTNDITSIKSLQPTTSSTNINSGIKDTKEGNQIDLLQLFSTTTTTTASTSANNESANIEKSNTSNVVQSYSCALKTPINPNESSNNNNNNTISTTVDHIQELSNLDKSLMPQPSTKELKKDQYHPPLPEKTNFLLLHLSLLRDYIDTEFQELRRELEDHPFIKYDLECIIDDWILMSILVGNDFVPNLPNLHINSGALPMLYKTYANVLPKLDGYLNENGNLRLDRFETYLKELSEFDIENFRSTYDDMKYMAAKTGKNIVLGEKMFDTPFEFDDDDGFNEDEEEELEVNSELQALINRTNEAVETKVEDSPDNEELLSSDLFPSYDDLFDEEDSPEFRLEFAQYKRNYYKTKIETVRPIREEVKAMVVEYIEAIQWVLLYYYKGVSSWCWYYPYHYAPFSSDLRNFKNFEIIFDKGQPFKPFEQLLAVLPSYSKKLLPACFQGLMINEDSPIKAYYPESFQQDLNGKKQDWEAVVCIPFIDEKKLIEAMNVESSKLNDKEIFRNARGKMLLHRFTKEDTGPVESPGNIFPRLSTTHVKVEGIEDVGYDPQLLPKGVHPRAKRDKIYQGFPTIKSIKHLSSLENAKVKVFDFLARDVSMVLDLSVLDEEEEKLQCETVARNLLGKTIWVNWPHLTQVLVTGVSDSNNDKYVLTEQGGIRKDPTYNKHDVVAKGLVERHLKYKGIKLGLIEIVIWAKLMEGRKVKVDRNGKMKIENLWGNIEQPFAHKTSILHDTYVTVFSMTDCESGTYKDIFREGDTVFLLERNLYGAMAKVKLHDDNRTKVFVEYNVPVYRRIDEESYDDIQEKLYNWGEENYFSSMDVARMCCLPTSVLAKLTGTIFVEVEKGQGQSPKKNKGGGKKQKNKNNNNKNGKEGKLDSQESVSSPEDEEEIQITQETKKVNVGLDLKFNKRNLKVRGYTSKDGNGKWIYSLKTVKLVQEYMKEFPDMVNFLREMSGKDRNEYKATEIYKKDSRGKIQEIEYWLENKGLRDAQKIDISANVMDEDEIQLVWDHVLATKVNVDQDIIKTKTVPPHLLFKPGLDRGNVLPGNDTNVQYELLDRVVCVDQSTAMPLGHKGTIVGIQQPQVQEEAAAIEESFKTTNATMLETLIILCDPQNDVFDLNNVPTSSNNTNISNETSSKSKEDMTSSLSSLLGINSGSSPGLNFLGNIGNSNQGEKPKDQIQKVKEEEYKPLPRLVKLFPFQVLKITGCEVQTFKEERSKPKTEPKTKPIIPNKTIIINNSNRRQVPYPTNILPLQQVASKNIPPLQQITSKNIPPLFPIQVLQRQPQQQPVVNKIKNLPFKPVQFVRGTTPSTSTLIGTHPNYVNGRPPPLINDLENQLESTIKSLSQQHKNTSQSLKSQPNNSSVNNNNNDRDRDRKGDVPPPITILKRPQQQQSNQQSNQQNKTKSPQKNPSQQNNILSKQQSSNSNSSSQQQSSNPINALLEQSLAKQKHPNNNKPKQPRNETKNKGSPEKGRENNEGKSQQQQQNRDKDRKQQPKQQSNNNIPQQQPQFADPIQQLVFQLQNQSMHVQQQQKQQQPNQPQKQPQQYNNVTRQQGNHNKQQQQQRKREPHHQQQTTEVNRMQIHNVQELERMRSYRAQNDVQQQSHLQFQQGQYHRNYPQQQQQQQHHQQQQQQQHKQKPSLFVPTQVQVSNAGGGRSAFASTRNGSSIKVNPKPLNQTSTPISNAASSDNGSNVQSEKPPEYSPYFRMPDSSVVVPKPIHSVPSENLSNNAKSVTQPTESLKLNFRGLSISYPPPPPPSSGQNNPMPETASQNNQNTTQETAPKPRRLAANFNF